MKIISWNVNGIRSRIFNDSIGSKLKKDKDIVISEDSPIQDILKYDPDVICFQETRCNKELGEKHIKIPGYRSFFNESLADGARSSNRYSGTAIFYKSHMQPVAIHTEINDYKDDEGRIIAMEFENFKIINVYAPNSGTNLDKKHLFIDAMLNYLNTSNDKFTIFCGDMNIAVDTHFLPSFEYAQMPGLYPHEIDFWTNLKDINFVDPIKCEIVYTWWDPRQRKENGMSAARNRNKGWRLDYFFVNQKTNHCSSKCLKVIGENNQGIPLASDHAPILLEITD